MAKRALHPGVILERDFLDGLGVSQYRLAVDIEVPPRRINEIVRGLRGISADTALRLAAFFGTSEGFWLGLQADYDLEEARLGMSKELLRVEQARAKYAAERKSRA